MADDINTLRRDLAVAYRFAALFGWDDTLHTHFSGRLSGAEPRFPISPFGLLFKEARAGELIVGDMHGKATEGDPSYKD